MKKLVNKNPRELSFTIFETIVAVGLLMAFTLEMAGGQGNIVNKVDYARKSNDAIWLAKRIMSHVEYNYQTMDLKELDTTSSVKDQKFEKVDDPEFLYTYSVNVQEWKFPLFDFLLKGGAQSEEDKDDPTKPEKKPEGAGMPGIDAILNSIFNGHIMKIANVEVSWPDGARRESVRLTYLLTNTRALDEYLGTKKTVFDGVIRKMTGGQVQQIATGPTCTQFDPVGSTPIAGGGGCLHPDGTTRRPDGSRITSTGDFIPAPTQTTPGQTIPGQTTTGQQTPNPSQTSTPNPSKPVN